LRISRELISQKLAAQERVARHKLLDSTTANGIARFRAELAGANSIATIRLIESQAARSYCSVDPTPIGNVMLTGISVPVRIGGVTVMPGDLVVGDREGVYFIPPQFVKAVLDHADETHIHDEWTKKKFDEGKYKSSEIYGSPSDPKLQKEYREYLKKRLDEIHKQETPQ
jgi:hypothetical protein